MEKEQILALADNLVSEWAEQGKMPPMAWDFRGLCVAAIASYKAELLKEVGEPVAYLHHISDNDDIEHFLVDFEKSHGMSVHRGDYPLFTSDQVAAAVLKAGRRLGEQ